jgi:hypothetical protein
MIRKFVRDIRGAFGRERTLKGGRRRRKKHSRRFASSC